MSDMFVFILPLPHNYRSKYNTDMLDTILKGAVYVNEWIDNEIYHLFHQYFRSYNEAIINIAGFAATYPDYVELINPGSQSTALMIMEIDNRRGYLYNVNSSFGMMVREKLDSELN